MVKDLRSKSVPGKLHWHCYTYYGNKLDTDRKVYACTYTGNPRSAVPLKTIEDNRNLAGVDNQAVVISISYLGHMTEEEFTKGTDAVKHV